MKIRVKKERVGGCAHRRERECVFEIVSVEEEREKERECVCEERMKEREREVMCVAGKTVIIRRDSFVCCLLEGIIDHLLWVVLFTVTLFLLKSRSKIFTGFLD